MNELTLSVTMTYSNPAANVKANTVSFVDPISIISSPAYERNVQVVTTSLVPLSLALITTLGYIAMHNADPVQPVAIYLNTTDTGSLLLNAGEWLVVRFNPACVPQVICSAGSPMLEYYAINN